MSRILALALVSALLLTAPTHAATERHLQQDTSVTPTIPDAFEQIGAVLQQNAQIATNAAKSAALATGAAIKNATSAVYGTSGASTPHAAELLRASAAAAVALLLLLLP
jgi:hypothetical protein